MEAAKRKTDPQGEREFRKQKRTTNPTKIYLPHSKSGEDTMPRGGADDLGNQETELRLLGKSVHFTHSIFQASTLFSFLFCEMLEFSHDGNHDSIPCQRSSLELWSLVKSWCEHTWFSLAGKFCVDVDVWLYTQ